MRRISLFSIDTAEELCYFFPDCYDGFYEMLKSLKGRGSEAFDTKVLSEET